MLVDTLVQHVSLQGGLFSVSTLGLQVHILNAVTHYKLNRFSHLVPAQPGIDVRTILILYHTSLCAATP